MKLILGMLLAHQAFGCCAWYQKLFFMTCCGDGPTKGQCLAVCITDVLDESIGGMRGGHHGHHGHHALAEPPVYYDEHENSYVEDPYYEEEYEQEREAEDSDFFWCEKLQPGDPWWDRRDCDRFYLYEDRVGGMYNDPAPSYNSAPSYDFNGYGGIGAMKWSKETRLQKAAEGLTHMHQIQHGYAAPEGTKIEKTCLVEHSTTFDGQEEINHKMEIENGAKAVHQYWMTKDGAIAWAATIKAQVEQETGFCVTNVHFCLDGVSTTRTKHIRTLLKDCTTSHPGFKAILDITKPLVSTLDPVLTMNTDLQDGGSMHNTFQTVPNWDQAAFNDNWDIDEKNLNGQFTVQRESLVSGQGVTKSSISFEP